MPSHLRDGRALLGAAFAARLAPRRHRSGIPGDRSAGRPPAAVARPCRPAVRYRAGAFSQAPRRRPKWQTVLVEIVHVAPAPLHVDASGAWDGSHGAFASVDMEEGTCVGLYLGDALRKVQADQLSAARKPYDAGNKTGQPYRDELISQGGARCHRSPPRRPARTPRFQLVRQRVSLPRRSTTPLLARAR